MALIQPFRGLRPRKDLVERVASPPYDVVNREEARRLAEGNEVSFLHITKPEIDLPDDTDPYADIVYQTARRSLKHFQQSGILEKDPEKYYYVYRQTWGEHVQVGLVAGASVQDYQDDIIKKHEFTRQVKERDRMRHIDALNANTGPVFLTFKQTAEVDELLETAMRSAPVYDFNSVDSVHHQFFVVSDRELIERFTRAFAALDRLYVADGHHRSAAATGVKIARQKNNPAHRGDEEYNFFLSVIFPHNQMKILPYNRVVRIEGDFCKAEFFHKISPAFEYSEAESATPRQPRQFCLYVSGKWYQLQARPGSFDAADPVQALDVAILQNNLLAPALGIEDPRTDTRIDFVGGIRGTGELEKRVDSGEFHLAFSLFPTTIEQLFRVADAGKTMPPKSTWFEPKLKSGLVTHLLDD